jgi:hypothetical protein
VSSSVWTRSRDVGGARQHARSAAIVAPTVARGGKFGESNAAREFESALIARLPRSRRSLKKMATCG